MSEFGSDFDSAQYLENKMIEFYKMLYIDKN